LYFWYRLYFFDCIIWNFKKHTDIELVEACLKGKSRAQKELYERFSYTMLGVCIRYSKNREEAEDILQEGFIKVFEKLGQYESFGPLGGWIRKVVLNTALEHCRKMKNKLPINFPVEELQIKDDDTSVIDSLALDDLVAKIQALPEGYRAVFNLYAIEGYNHNEIAELMDVTSGTSKSQYSKAKAMLRLMISQEHTEERRVSHAK
jgi:RNA polymerase sigma factor (sigma-70 family)